MSRMFSTAAMSVAILASAISQGQSQEGQSQDRSDGQSIFRFDTFGDEQLWTDTLRMQEVLQNVSPRTALSVGLKVDSDALPSEVIKAIKAGQVNLDDPAVTIQLYVQAQCRYRRDRQGHRRQQVEERGNHVRIMSFDGR